MIRNGVSRSKIIILLSLSVFILVIAVVDKGSIAGEKDSFSTVGDPDNVHNSAESVSVNSFPSTSVSEDITIPPPIAYVLENTSISSEEEDSTMITDNRSNANDLNHQEETHYNINKYNETINKNVTIDDLKSLFMKTREKYHSILEEQYGEYTNKIFQRSTVFEKVMESPSNVSMERLKRRMKIKIIQAVLSDD